MRYLIAALLLVCSTVAQAAVLIQSPNGTLVANPAVKTLAQAAVSPAAAGKTVVVTSALSASFSNISSATVHSWPADRVLRVEKGGSIANSTAFTVDGPLLLSGGTFSGSGAVTVNSAFPSVSYHVFTGPGIVALNNTPGIKPEWFGAAGNKTADDSVAVQKAITTCIAPTGAPIPLIVTGKYLIKTPVNIDRKNEAATEAKGYLNINAIGAGAGFYTDTAIKIFTSSFTFSADAVAMMVKFNGVTFESTDAALATYVLDSKFIRIDFNKCFFNAMHAMTATNICFSFSFTDCLIRNWSGTFFRENWAGATDVSFIGNQIQGGDLSVTLVEMGYAAQGFRFISNTVENVGYAPIRLSGARGGVISGNYFEANALVGDKYYIDLNYASSGAPIAGMSISGNMLYLTPGQIADPTYYPINAENAVNLSIEGNWTSSALLYKAAGVYQYGVYSAGNSVSTLKPLRSNLNCGGLNIITDTNSSYQNVYSIRTVEVAKKFDSDLFDAAATTDSVVVWQQPANSLLIGFRVLHKTQFAATGMTDLDIVVGDADPDGLFVEAMNLTDAPSGVTMKTRGALWNGGAVGTEIYSSVAKDWTARATSIGANLSNLTAGEVIFYFVYRLL